MAGKEAEKGDVLFGAPTPQRNRCTLPLNTRYADGAMDKAKAVLDSALELGNDPKKVVFGGRGLFEQLKRKHLSGKDRDNKGAKELALWKVAHQVVATAEEHRVALATERLKYLRKSRRDDGTGRWFRRKGHRFAYRALLEKIHALAQKRGVEALEVDPQDTSTIGMLKYAPQLSLSKDIAAALVIGRRALGYEEKLPKGYRALLSDRSFLAHAEGFHQSRFQELTSLREAEGNPYRKRALSRKIRKARRALSLLSAFRGFPGSRRKGTDGRNFPGAHLWRVLREDLCLPLLGREVPRDLSPLKPILLGSWERWRGSLGSHPGGESACRNVRFG